MLNILSKYSLSLCGVLFIVVIASGAYIKSLLEDVGSLRENSKYMTSVILEQSNSIRAQASQHELDLKVIKDRDSRLSEIRKSRDRDEKILNETVLNEKDKECFGIKLPADYLNVLRTP